MEIYKRCLDDTEDNKQMDDALGVSELCLEPMSKVALNNLISPGYADLKVARNKMAKKGPDTSASLCIELLPVVVLGKIISYLHWKEKEWLLMAVPSMERVINSPLAWESFENDRSYAVEKLYMYICFPVLMEHELNVIKKYGRFFQSCTIWIHKVTTLDKGNGNDFRLIKAVSQHCQHLKTLRIMHTSDISVSLLKTCAHTYIMPLQKLSLNRGTGFRISLNRLFYSSVESFQSGIASYLTYLNEKRLLIGLSCLDFSHGLILDLGSNQKISLLHECVNLHTLKCPVQSLTSTVVMHLVNRKLKDLYVVNDDHTQQTAFFEKLFIDWNKMYSDLPHGRKQRFNVHYIFKNRTVSNDDIIPNPFLRSLVFDNLSSNISSSLLLHIANVYGETMLNLAFCSNYWEFLMHFADLGKINDSFRYLAYKCVQLRSFLSCLSLPSSALVSLAKHSRSVSTIRVYKENVRLASTDKPEGIFLNKMSEALGSPNWDMIKKGNNIFIIPSVDCKMLFASCFSEF